MIKYLPANKLTGISTVLSMSDLHPHMEVHSNDFYDRLRADMELSGLNHPIVVTRMTIGVWKKMREVNPDILPPPEGPDGLLVYQIRCGNNRYKIAKEMGYTLVDCYIVDMREANQICHDQRCEY